jgi:hypothetical protein
VEHVGKDMQRNRSLPLIQRTQRDNLKMNEKYYQKLISQIQTPVAPRPLIFQSKTPNEAPQELDF